MVRVKEEDQRRIVGIAFKALLLDLFAFTIILPLFPRLLNYYQSEELADQTSILGYALQGLEQFKYLILTNKRASVKTGYVDKWDTVLLGGLIGSLFSLLQFIVSPMIGRASDRLGRRKVLLYTMIGNILSTVVWLFSCSFNLFLVSRVIAGLSEGNVQLSIAIISDVTTPEKRSRSLALVGIAFAIAFTVGPAIGAWFASIDLSLLCPSLVQFGIYPYSMAAFVGLVLLAVETAYLYFALPETIHFRKEIEAASTSTDELKEKITVQVIHRRLLDLYYVKQIMFAFSFLFSGMEFTLVFLTYDILDYSHMQQGKLLGFMGIVSAIIQGGYVRRKVQTMGEKMIIIQGMVSCAAGLYCLSTTANSEYPVYWLYAGVAFLAFTSGTVVNCLTSLASLQCLEESNGDDALSKGRALGEFRSFGQLGRAFGPMFASSVYWIFGPGVCYGIGSVIMVASVWVTVLIAPNKQIKRVRKVKKAE
ncbi:MFS, DHA1 sub-family [Helicostylum pulchrum]|uniref:Major facilitator superfamily (MFS) profile domain-containing protein n=1 Tax=Helicostylum pulchrum TaxID=562976 RepID=A0ABP9YB72_9FUNG|nr:MFS, DHA1 sub-family [Helicostylum pulchrum]